MHGRILEDRDHSLRGVVGRCWAFLGVVGCCGYKKWEKTQIILLSHKIRI